MAAPVPTTASSQSALELQLVTCVLRTPNSPKSWPVQSRTVLQSVLVSADLGDQSLRGDGAPQGVSVAGGCPCLVHTHVHTPPVGAPWVSWPWSRGPSMAWPTRPPSHLLLFCLFGSGRPRLLTLQVADCQAAAAAAARLASPRSSCSSLPPTSFFLASPGSNLPTCSSAHLLNRNPPWTL